MYHITLWLNVEWSASLLSHSFSLNFLTLGFCFPQPRPQGLFAFQYGGSRSPSLWEQALHLGESREVTRDGRACSRGSFCLTFESLLAGSGFSLGNSCKGVFEWCTSTGNRFFTFLSSFFAQIFSWIVSTCVKKLSNTNVIASRHIKREKFSLPFDVGLSKAAY